MVFDTALPRQKLSEASSASPRFGVKRNSLHSAFPVPNSRESFISAPSVFLFKLEATGFEFGRKKEGTKRSFRQTWRKRSGVSFF